MFSMNCKGCLSRDKVIIELQERVEVLEALLMKMERCTSHFADEASDSLEMALCDVDFDITEF